MGNVIFLTDAERTRFAAYLEQDACSDDGMAQQLDTVQAASPVAAMLRQKAAAKLLVAQHLRSGETMEIGAGGST